MVAETSVLEWKVMSRLVRRLPIAASVVDGASRSCSVASGLICGPMKRMAEHWESRRAMPRLVTAREQALSQLKCVALALVFGEMEVEVWMKSMSCSSAESWRRRSLISWRAENAAIARRSWVRSWSVSNRLVCSCRRWAWSWASAVFESRSV
jgi:hypothetical protein